MLNNLISSVSKVLLSIFGGQTHGRSFSTVAPLALIFRNPLLTEPLSGGMPIMSQGRVNKRVGHGFPKVTAAGTPVLGEHEAGSQDLHHVHRDGLPQVFNTQLLSKHHRQFHVYLRYLILYPEHGVTILVTM